MAHSRKNLPVNGPPLSNCGRVVGRVCRWNSRNQRYDDYEYIYETDACSELTVDTFYRGDTKGNGTGNRFTTAVPQRRTVQCRKFQLKHGEGWVKVYPNFVDPDKSERIAESVLNSGKFRQYQVQCHNEPRIHFLVGTTGQTFFEMAAARAAQLVGSVRKTRNSTKRDSFTSRSSTDDTEEGYYYHGVKMKPDGLLSEFPDLLDVAVEAAQLSGLMHGLATSPDRPPSYYHQQPVLDPFNIGVNPVVYRNHDDGINWHADDTHNEYRVFSYVPRTSSPLALGRTSTYDAEINHLPRPICVRKKLLKGQQLEDGDEYMELFVGAGDAYEMNGAMQEHYEHALLKVRTSKSYNREVNDDTWDKNKIRMVIVFRHGERRAVGGDSGLRVTSLLPRRRLTPEERYPIGSMADVLQEGKVYKRSYLWQTYAHFNDRRGISGTRDWGCCAIVVAKQRLEEHELDNFTTLTYTSNGTQGAACLIKSLQDKIPVRVFRSSECHDFAALFPGGRKDASAVYRYDGLYQVKCAWDTEALKAGEKVTVSTAPLGKTAATFELDRIDAIYGLAERKGNESITSNSQERQHSNMITNAGLILQSIKNHTMETLPGMEGLEEWTEKQFSCFLLERWHSFWGRKRSQETSYLPLEPAPVSLPFVSPSPRPKKAEANEMVPPGSPGEMPPLQPKGIWSKWIQNQSEVSSACEALLCMRRALFEGFETPQREPKNCHAALANYNPADPTNPKSGAPSLGAPAWQPHNDVKRRAAHMSIGSPPEISPQKRIAHDLASYPCTPQREPSTWYAAPIHERSLPMRVAAYPYTPQKSISWFAAPCEPPVHGTALPMSASAHPHVPPGELMNWYVSPVHESAHGINITPPREKLPDDISFSLTRSHEPIYYTGV